MHEFDQRRLYYLVAWFMISSLPTFLAKVVVDVVLTRIDAVQFSLISRVLRISDVI